jgi:primosomal protein N' (replication factor Y) (superfamily II helicase)
MRFAHIVLGLPVDRPFDYAIPEDLQEKAVPGCRVAVNFRGKKAIGYIVNTASRSIFPSVKPLLALIDEHPLLPAQLLELARALSRYYCCSWGEMIETAVPDRLRKGARVEASSYAAAAAAAAAQVNVLQSQDAPRRWEEYCKYISAALAVNKRAIILLPDTGAIPHCCALLRNRFPSASVGILFRKQPDELAEWLKVRNGGYSIVVGTRSAVFAPLADTGLIIVDEEQDRCYKQEQAPHYHARVAALERCRIEGGSVVFGSGAPSLELIKLCTEGGGRLTVLPPSRRPAVKTIDTTRLPFGVKSRVYLSKYAQDAILATISAGGKALVFLNRKGFATSAVCSTCGAVLKCPGCSTNLVYYFREQSLACSYCNFKMAPPKLCPKCSSGYIKYGGAGTEKVESELARMFPSARLAIISREAPSDLNSADIFVSTQSVLSHGEYAFDLSCVLALDNSLNHADFRATERAFSLLTGLAAITRREMIIQTTVPGHYAVRAVENADPGVFYEQELALRKQLLFPPFRHFCLIKCRGVSDERTRDAANALHGIVSSAKRKPVTAVSVNPGQPAQMRGQFYWQLLLSAVDPVKASAFIKNCLNDFRRSGIIVTVDMDPTA